MDKCVSRGVVLLVGHGSEADEWQVSTEITCGVWARIACQIWRLWVYLLDFCHLYSLVPHTGLTNSLVICHHHLLGHPTTLNLAICPAYSCQNTVPKVEPCLKMLLAKTYFLKPKKKKKVIIVQSYTALHGKAGAMNQASEVGRLKKQPQRTPTEWPA